MLKAGSEHLFLAEYIRGSAGPEVLQRINGNRRERRGKNGNGEEKIVLGSA